ncbi:MAG TPA: phosphatase PAP2-related protein [Candidatus Dojkabacteria bacterium]|nr:phosphatase PAP2-related protein [Candidatus Dojkabacteria bacterium]
MKFIYPLIFLIFASVLNAYFGNVLIPQLAPDRVVMHDISFAVLPYWESAALVNDYILLFMFGVFIYLGYRNGFKNFDKYLWAFGWLYMLRAFTIVMNPVGASWDGYDNRNIESLLSMALDHNGFFFSGHTGTVVLLSFFISEMLPKFKWYLLVVALVVMGLIMIGRSHYLIDVYGGIVTALLVYKLIVRK